MSTTDRLQLPLILPSQAQKHVTHNEALLKLDILVQLTVTDRLSAPPATPSEGERFIVGADPSGIWETRQNSIAVYQGDDWLYLEPEPGWRTFDLYSSTLLVFSGSHWVAAPGATEVPALGVNTAVDENHRLSVRGSSTLFAGEAGDHRIHVNKQTEADTASVVFESGYSGRAEVGLAGNDALSMKVADQNGTWRNAITVAPDTANVGLGGVGDPQAPLHVAGSMRLSSNSAFVAFYDDTEQARSGYLQVHKDHGYYFVCELARPMMFYTSNQLRLLIESGGNVGIGGISEPTAALHVGGPVRVGSFQVATLPSASGSGAGTIIHVDDEAGGSVLAFSDGAVWRRVTDRAQVTA